MDYDKMTNVELDSSGCDDCVRSDLGCKKTNKDLYLCKIHKWRIQKTKRKCICGGKDFFYFKLLNTVSVGSTDTDYPSASTRRSIFYHCKHCGIVYKGNK